MEIEEGFDQPKFSDRNSDLREYWAVVMRANDVKEAFLTWVDSKQGSITPAIFYDYAAAQRFRNDMEDRFGEREAMPVYAVVAVRYIVASYDFPA